MSHSCALTTIDNEFNPFDDFVKWYNRDAYELGYNTCERIATIAQTSDEFTDEENEKEIERAIDEIIRYDFLNIYRKVQR
jgi:hypothetical protein